MDATGSPTDATARLPVDAVSLAGSKAAAASKKKNGLKTLQIKQSRDKPHFSNNVKADADKITDSRVTIRILEGKSLLAADVRSSRCILKGQLNTII
jgi:hypothetical protein